MYFCLLFAFLSFPSPSPPRSLPSFRPAHRLRGLPAPARTVLRPPAACAAGVALVVLGNAAEDVDDDDDEDDADDDPVENDSDESGAVRVNARVDGTSGADADGKSTDETQNRRPKRSSRGSHGGNGGSVFVWHLESGAVVDRFFGDRAQIFLRQAGCGCGADDANASESSAAAAAAAGNAALTWDAEFNAQVRSPRMFV